MEAPYVMPVDPLKKARCNRRKREDLMRDNDAGKVIRTDTETLVADHGIEPQAFAKAVE
jgi:hypothetical protein